MNKLQSIVLAGMLIGVGRFGFAAESLTPATTAAAMGAEAVEQFVVPLKRGTPIELTLSKGKVLKGLFSSYDDYYETLWIVPQGERGVFNEKGIKLSGIYKVSLWDKKTAPVNVPETFKQETFGSKDYQLLEEKDRK